MVEMDFTVHAEVQCFYLAHLPSHMELEGICDFWGEILRASGQFEVFLHKIRSLCVGILYMTLIKVSNICHAFAFNFPLFWFWGLDTKWKYANLRKDWQTSYPGEISKHSFLRWNSVFKIDFSVKETFRKNKNVI